MFVLMLPVSLATCQPSNPNNPGRLAAQLLLHIDDDLRGIFFVHASQMKSCRKLAATIKAVFMYF